MDVHRDIVSSSKIIHVSSKGRLKALSKGTATIYIYAQNGRAKTLKVKVK